MGVVEFQLARLTAQSKRSNPKIPTGGAPEITVEDVRTALVSCPRPVYLAVAAKVCQCERAELELRKVAHRVSSIEWRRNPMNYRTRASLEQIDLIADAAVLAFLNPNGEEDDDGNRVKRDEEWAARVCKVSVREFASNYRFHWKRVGSVLEGWYAEGASRFRSILAFRPERLDLP